MFNLPTIRQIGIFEKDLPPHIQTYCIFPYRRSFDVNRFNSSQERLLANFQFYDTVIARFPTTKSDVSVHGCIYERGMTFKCTYM